MMDRGNHSAYSPASTSSGGGGQLKRDPATVSSSSAARPSAAAAIPPSSASAAAQDLLRGGVSGGIGSPYRYLDGGAAGNIGGDRSAYLQTLVDLAKARERAAYGGTTSSDTHPLLSQHLQLQQQQQQHSSDYQRLSATLSNLGYGGAGGSGSQLLQSNDSFLLAMEVLKQQQNQQDGSASGSSSSAFQGLRSSDPQHPLGGLTSRQDVLEALKRLEHSQGAAAASGGGAASSSAAAAAHSSDPHAAALRHPHASVVGRAALKEALEASASLDYAGGALASDRALALEIYRQQHQLQQLNSDQQSRSLLASAALGRGGVATGGSGSGADVLATLRLLGQNQATAASLRDVPDPAASSSSAASMEFGGGGGMSSLERSLALDLLKQKQQLQLQEQQSRTLSAAAAVAQRARFMGSLGTSNAAPAAASAGSDLYAALQLMGQQSRAAATALASSDSLGLDVGGAAGGLGRFSQATAAASSVVRKGADATTSASLVRAASHARASERASLDLSLCKTSSDTVRVLKVLGSTIRSKDDPFVDVDALPDLKHPYSEYKAPICGDLLFPDKLHILLEDAEREGFSDVVSWLPHRRAFRVHNKARFLSDVMPRHFKGKGVWSSFRRQLNLYGFARTKKGIDAGSYYHELFLQGRKELSQFMFRVGRPRPGLDRRASSKLVEGDDPDFYSLPALRDRRPPADNKKNTSSSSAAAVSSAAAQPADAAEQES